MDKIVWPLPALLAWALAWLGFLGLGRFDVPIWLPLAAVTSLSMLLAMLGSTPWRRIFIALGFPVSMLASGLAASVPAWAWLAPLALLGVLYPVKSWRDAPLFPTPAGGLRGLATLVPLPERARIVDAGCGLGAGLRELRHEYPGAQFDGWEWSWPLRVACGWRCRFARITRADIWAADWSAHDMVYLFQRPESMARAATKATSELRRGAWLASLEFEVPRLHPRAVLNCSDGRRVWLYQTPFQAR